MIVMAVIMLLMDHVKYDLFCIHKDTTIMKMRESFFETNDEKQTEKQDAYIYFYTHNSVWIGSGKVTGRFFLVRHKEHLIEASTEHATSCFYL